jgi:hypothetical protein
MRWGGAGVAARAASQVVPVVRQWAAAELLGIDFSGSYGKGTAISPGTDVDLFVSLDSAAGSLKDTYWSLFRWCADHHLPPQAGNVSVRVVCDGVRVDLVPGRKQKGATTDHTLYRRKADSWTQTNVGQHIRLVATSGRTDEIRAIKIWRELHHLDFPSVYLELSVIEALKGRRAESLAANVGAALAYLGGDFLKARVVDPGQQQQRDFG